MLSITYLTGRGQGRRALKDQKSAKVRGESRLRTWADEAARRSEARSQRRRFQPKQGKKPASGRAGGTRVQGLMPGCADGRLTCVKVMKGVT